jgi:hypothetical protein
MKTPVVRPNAVRIIVQPPNGPIVPAVSGERLSGSEAWQIVKAIGPRFAEYASQYDTKKYWPEVYERVGQEFRQPEAVGPSTLRDALLWKYGHLRKPAIPPAHERLISRLQRGWPAAVAALPNAPEDAFVALDRDFGGKTRFITVAFLLHLLHPRKVPIIDQHNFRAVNALMAGVRPTWKTRRQPSQYTDISLVAAFMEAVLAAWVLRAPESAPSGRDLDKFLMMYGKAIKERSNKRLHLTPAVTFGQAATTARGRRK